MGITRELNESLRKHFLRTNRLKSGTLTISVLPSLDFKPLTSLPNGIFTVQSLINAQIDPLSMTRQSLNW